MRDKVFAKTAVRGTSAFLASEARRSFICQGFEAILTSKKGGVTDGTRKRKFYLGKL